MTEQLRQDHICFWHKLGKACRRQLVLLLIGLALASIPLGSYLNAIEHHGVDAGATITVETADGVKIFGDPFMGDLSTETPLVMLFHQGGSNGRAEYSSIAPWLNENGFRAIAWDQRNGGDLYGASNRTKAVLAEGTAADYCDAYPDLQAAVNYVVEKGIAQKVIVWGSSYSGALVYQLAAKNPSSVSAVIAFSPASGGPLANCRAIQWIEGVSATNLVVRPQSEMARASAQEQRRILSAAGTEFIVVEHGIHGSSLLVDERTEHDMSEARADVLAWLKKVTASHD